MVARHADFINEMYIGGDFNCALNENDRTTENKDPSTCRALLKKFIENLDLKDAWFKKHTYTQYTFNSGFQQEWNRCYINLEMSFYNPFCFAWHIDYL